MTIIPSSKGIQFDFEEDMLLVEDRLSGDDHKEIQSLLKSSHEENRIRENFENVLTNIVNMLDSRGTYINTIKFQTGHPRIQSFPYLLLSF